MDYIADSMRTVGMIGGPVMLFIIGTLFAYLRFVKKSPSTTQPSQATVITGQKVSSECNAIVLMPHKIKEEHLDAPDIDRLFNGWYEYGGKNVIVCCQGRNNEYIPYQKQFHKIQGDLPSSTPSELYDMTEWDSVVYPLFSKQHTGMNTLSKMAIWGLFIGICFMAYLFWSGSQEPPPVSTAPSASLLGLTLLLGNIFGNPVNDEEPDHYTGESYPVVDHKPPNPTSSDMGWFSGPHDGNGSKPGGKVPVDMLLHEDKRRQDNNADIFIKPGDNPLDLLMRTVIIDTNEAISVTNFYSKCQRYDNDMGAHLSNYPLHPLAPSLY